MIINPYSGEGQWYKGNLHTHTENSACGHYSVSEVLEFYKAYKMKYDFLAITDHFTLTQLEEFNEEELILFTGTEYKKNELQTLGINISEYNDDPLDINNHQELFNSVINQGGINIICHPHVYKEDYWPIAKLLELEGYNGIEIYNNNVRMDNSGRAVATDLWDKLLSSGKRIYGFANDDMHIFSRVGGAFNVVLAREKTKESILNSIKNGSFYASTGIYIKKIQLQENYLRISLSDKIPAEFCLIGYDGKIIESHFGYEVCFNLQEYKSYIRVTIMREDGAKAWTQPFFID